MIEVIAPEDCSLGFSTKQVYHKFVKDEVEHTRKRKKQMTSDIYTKSFTELLEQGTK